MRYELYQHSELPQFVLIDEKGKEIGKSRVFLNSQANFGFCRTFHGIEDGFDDSPSERAYVSLSDAMQAAHDFLIFEYYHNVQSFQWHEVKDIFVDTTDFFKENQLEEVARKYSDWTDRVCRDGLAYTGSPH